METKSPENTAQNASVTKQAQVSAVTTNLSSLNIGYESKKTYFPFMDLPPEIRNKIYAFAFIMSRYRDAIYDIPDFIVHGHGKNRGGIKWKNVENFYLILACKKTFLEALPIISTEAFMEIKVYIDESPRRRRKKANAAYETLKRTALLCQDVKKVVLNVTPTDFDIDFREDEQLPRIAGVLKDYKKLEEVTLKVRPSSIASTSWLPLMGFFFLARQGVSLCFELLDYAIEEGEDQDIVDEIVEERKDAEDKIKSMSDKYGGDKPNIWVEWNIAEDDREYY